MYHILKIYTIIFSILLSKINFKMVKCGMVMLIKREKTDVTDADVSLDWMTATGALMVKSKKKN
jgi:hypothetical protein